MQIADYYNYNDEDYVMYNVEPDSDSDSDPESREIDYPDTPEPSDVEYDSESDHCWNWQLPCNLDEEIDEYPDLNELEIREDRNIVYAQNMESIKRLQKWLRRQITVKRIRQLQRCRGFMEWYYAPQNPGGIIAKRQLFKFAGSLQNDH